MVFESSPDERTQGRVTYLAIMTTVKQRLYNKRENSNENTVRVACLVFFPVPYEVCCSLVFKT